MTREQALLVLGALTDEEIDALTEADLDRYLTALGYQVDAATTGLADVEPAERETADDRVA